MSNKRPKDIDLPKDHPFYGTIVYDPVAKEWYNKKTDIYLSEDDVIYHKLQEINTTNISGK